VARVVSFPKQAIAIPSVRLENVAGAIRALPYRPVRRLGLKYFRPRKFDRERPVRKAKEGSANGKRRTFAAGFLRFPYSFTPLIGFALGEVSKLKCPVLSRKTPENPYSAIGDTPSAGCWPPPD
jgi:hypothetical protein